MATSVNRNRLKRAYFEGRRQANEDMACPYTNEDLAQRWSKGRADQLSGNMAEPPDRPEGQHPAFNSRPERPDLVEHTPAYTPPESYLTRDRRSDAPKQAGFGKYRKVTGRGRRF
jgi:hypothetical protein